MDVAILRAPAARWAVTLAAMCSILGVTAHAQVRRPPPKPPAGPTPQAGSWEVGGGSVFVGGYDLGSVTAELTRNTTGGTGPFELFDGDSKVNAAGAVQGRVAYYFSPRLAVEGGVRFGKPVFEVSLTADAESAPDTVAEEALDQYVFDASVLWHFPRGPVSRARLVPFVLGGAGYIRELHESQELVETGAEYHAGAGLKFWLGNARRRFGIRGEGGISLRDGGVDFEEKVRLVPVASVSLIYLF
jgi:hypothetical protein